MLGANLQNHSERWPANRDLCIKVAHYFIFTNKETSVGKKYDEILICQMIDFLMDNIYIRMSNHLFQQGIGILMGKNCAPFLASFFCTHMKLNF